MMTKTTLSDGRRTRPRFAAPTPTPPKFLIGTDDPARIGILPVLRREGSDQRESKGFGWDPAKTLRMAEPPEFLIGTIDQSENHSTPAKQTTYPNPNGHKTALSGISRPLSGLVPRADSPARPRFAAANAPSHPPTHRTFAMAQLRLCNVETLPQSRTACAAPPAQAFRVASVDRLHTICAASPAQPRFAAANAPSASAAAHRSFRISRPRLLFGLIPFAQPYPRKKTSGRGFIPSVNSRQTSSPPLAPIHPRKLSRLRQSLGLTPLAQLHPRNLDSPQRTSLPHPQRRIAVLVMSRPRPSFSLHTACAALPAQENVREGIYPLRKQPSNQFPTSCADSPAQAFTVASVARPHTTCAAAPAQPRFAAANFAFRIRSDASQF